MKITLSARNCENKSIFVILDAAHLIKLVRNTLGDLKTIISKNGEAIRWYFVQELYNLQTEEGLHLANKLRRRHVEYNKYKMKVNLATQTISDSVASSIDFSRTHLKLKQFVKSEATTEFLRVFDSIFDVMNSRSPFGKYSKSPMRRTNEKYWQKILSDSESYISTLRYEDGTLVIEGSVLLYPSENFLIVGNLNTYIKYKLLTFHNHSFSMGNYILTIKYKITA